MKEKFDIKKHITFTNITIVVLFLMYVLDCYLPFPEGYNGFNAWNNDVPSAFNYIFGSCGGLLKNYLAIMGEKMMPGEQQIYRHFTMIFMHGHILHLIANLVGMYFIGNYTEKRFGWWLTALMFFTISFVESFISDPFYLVFAPQKADEIASTYTCGASAGIFGIMGASFAAILFDPKSIKKVGTVTLTVSVSYGVLTTYIVSFGWTTLCHNVSLLLGMAVGTLIILPFYVLKKGKFAPQIDAADALPISENAYSEEKNKDL